MLFNRCPPSLPLVDPGAKDVTSYGTAALAAAAVAYGCVQAKRKRDSASVVDLYNALVDLPEATDLTPQIVAVRAKEYRTYFFAEDWSWGREKSWGVQGLGSQGPGSGCACVGGAV